jgi:DNA-binding transcriptional MerR regulator
VTLIKINELSKLYYSIGELAKLLNVNPSLLRFWEREFKLIVVKKNNKGNRLYSVKEIQEINNIYQLVKIQGFTIEGAKKALKIKTSDKVQASNEPLNTVEVIEKLEQIKRKLIRLKSI